MLILISPAKSLDFDTDTSKQIYSKAEYTHKSELLIQILRDLGTDEISCLMKISPKLSQLNYERYNTWQLPFDIKNAKQAILAFTGDVYTGIDAPTFNDDDFLYAQDNLRILSGLYGILKPMDLIQAYRLEMGTKLENQLGNNLYKFWGNIISDNINTLLKDKNYLINLASQEYFKSVNSKVISKPIITPIFKDFKNGKYKIISFYAKRARGLMARYIIKNKVDTIDDIKMFNEDGYIYNENMSDGLNICFTRNK